MTGAIREAHLSLMRSPLAVGLRSRLSEPWRAYHVWEHFKAIVGHMEHAEADGVAIHDPVACIGFAAWHDSIYDPRSEHGRNEELSALLCEAEMPTWADAHSVASAAAATRATTKHRVPNAVVCPDAALQLDCDLAILAGAPRVIDAFERDIRFEYSHVEIDFYRERRAGVLATFLERDRLYVTDWAHARWEAAARDNLHRTIAALKAAA
jgi:predicted metal-dependent HD superfamily phosphohydrolase